MFKFAHAAGAEDWMALAESCVAELGEVRNATLGFVYATDFFATEFDAIVAHLRSATGIETWIGTVGIGIVAGASEYFDIPALATMVTDLTAERFHLLPPSSADALPTGLAAWTRAHGPAVAVVHGDGRDQRLNDRLADLTDLPGAFVVGGLGSTRTPMHLVAGEIGRGPLAGIVFARDVIVATGLTQGCAPIGHGRRRITKAEGNVVHTLDERPAIEALQADLLSLPEQERALAVRRLHVALPIVGSDGADYLVRNLVGIDAQRGAIIIGDMAEPGRELIFVRRDTDAATIDLHRMGRETRARSRAAPQAALYFTCLARGPNLFGPDGEELAALRAEIGDAPLIGLFCDGEISNARLYGYTGVLALFS